MKAKVTNTPEKVSKALPMTPDERDRAAAKAMSKALRAEHKRWNMPFVSWKDGKIVMVKP